MAKNQIIDNTIDNPTDKKVDNPTDKKVDNPTDKKVGNPTDKKVDKQKLITAKKLIKKIREYQNEKRPSKTIRLPLMDDGITEVRGKKKRPGKVYARLTIRYNTNTENVSMGHALEWKGMVVFPQVLGKMDSDEKILQYLEKERASSKKYNEEARKIARGINMDGLEL